MNILITTIVLAALTALHLHRIGLALMTLGLWLVAADVRHRRALGRRAALLRQAQISPK